MNIQQLETVLDITDVGLEMHRLVAELYPICRSITGKGVRDTLQIMKRLVPLSVHEIPTGVQVFDWTIPREWNIRDAYVKNSRGDRIIDFRQSNLHVLNYSIPVKKRVGLQELKEHTYSDPEHPQWIPYRTSYYKEDWGFCMSHNQLLSLEDGEYEVFIDSTLEDGYLTYGELFLQGESPEEVLISCHICHPSLCNDNLSSMALTVYLAKYLSVVPHRYSYRFVFIPGTIGSIAWLCVNEAAVPNIRHGLVVACVGDSGRFTYKKSRRGDAEIDRAAVKVLKDAGVDHEVIDFFPYGYDERQYGSPGFNLPVGCLMRTPHGRYPEYHTSGDDLSLVKAENLSVSLGIYLSVLHVLEHNRVCWSLNPKCEPQLGRRGLYDRLGGGNEGKTRQLAMLWVLNLSDGEHSLLDIAERSGVRFEMVRESADVLLEHGLLSVLEKSGSRVRG